MFSCESAARLFKKRDNLPKKRDKLRIIIGKVRLNNRKWSQKRMGAAILLAAIPR